MFLGDRPRTASVDVIDSFTGYRLPRDAFLEALAGTPGSVSAAHALVSRRLAELEH